MAGALTISTLNNDTGVLATQNGMTGIPKAWVNFNGTNGAVSGTPFNVSSVTRNSTGNYSINMTTALPNANYSATIGASYLSGGTRYVNRLTGTFPTSTTICTVLCNDYLGGSADVDSISVAVLSS
jgi:hypothetical protein